MSYRPWGGKESDMTEQLTATTAVIRNERNCFIRAPKQSCWRRRSELISKAVCSDKDQQAF